MVNDDVDLVLGPFEVVSPNFEASEDGKQLVMSIVVALGASEGARMEGMGWTSPSRVIVEIMPVMA